MLSSCGEAPHPRSRGQGRPPGCSLEELGGLLSLPPPLSTFRPPLGTW